jgi:acetyl coenzyme A synthetase (ADP forming)-like protein
MAVRLLSEPEAYQLLERAGIPVPRYGIAKNEAEAAHLAGSVGFPVVMKIVSPQVIHKSDVGGVVTGIMSEEGAGNAYRQILENLRKRAPQAVPGGVIVEQQMPAGFEVIIGGKTDPAFGKVLTFGLGGTLVELLRDVSIRILPVDKNEISRMIRQIQGYPLIRGFRGSGPKDEEGITAILLLIGALYQESATIREFDLNPVILYEKGACVVDARIYVQENVEETFRAEVSSVPPEIFHPRTIAVIGASSDPRKVGYAVFRNLLPFSGGLYPVNPNRSEVLGRKAYPSITAVPEAVDTAVIAVPAALVPQVLREAGEKKIRLAVIVSAGFRETGAAGKDLEQEITAIAHLHGIRIVGPNSLGMMFPHRGINATFDPITPRAGRIGFISQSGAIITTIVDWSIAEQIGFSAVISVGNQVDLGFVDYLDIVAADPDTRAIILYIEEIRGGKEFLEKVTEVARIKPVIALKSGSSQKGKEAAISHTGSLAGSYDVYMAAFRQAGVIPVRSLSEAFSIAELLSSEGYPKGQRAIVITSAGGFAVLASDYADHFGVDIPHLPPTVLDELNAFLPPGWNHENPMDIIGDAGADRYARVFDVMIRHQEAWDIAFVIGVPDAVLDATQLGQEIARFSKNTQKMIVGCLLGGESMKSGIRILRDRGIPNYPDLENAFRTVGTVLQGMRPFL